MDKEQQEAISKTVRELIDIKYELSNWLDDGLVELAERFDKAIASLIEATSTASFIDQ